MILELPNGGFTHQSLVNQFAERKTEKCKFSAYLFLKHLRLLPLPPRDLASVNARKRLAHSLARTECGGNYWARSGESEITRNSIPDIDLDKF